jgi:hypothetical protein
MIVPVAETKPLPGGGCPDAEPYDASCTAASCQLAQCSGKTVTFSCQAIGSCFGGVVTARDVPAAIAWAVRTEST